MFRLNDFLHHHPLVVVLIGTVLIFVSVLTPRRVNYWLLILYSIFILYMTLWDRSGESRAKLELFWSYKQFFTSKLLRQEIVNNIWLFIPLGAMLCKLWPKVWILIVPLVFSIAVEAVQFVTGFGLCEIDDVISNSLGGVIGFVLGKGIVTGLRKVYRKTE